MSWRPWHFAARDGPTMHDSTQYALVSETCRHTAVGDALSQTVIDETAAVRSAEQSIEQSPFDTPPPSNSLPVDSKQMSPAAQSPAFVHGIPKAPFDELPAPTAPAPVVPAVTKPPAIPMLP